RRIPASRLRERGKACASGLKRRYEFIYAATCRSAAISQVGRTQVWLPFWPAGRKDRGIRRFTAAFSSILVTTRAVTLARRRRRQSPNFSPRTSKLPIL